MPDPMTMIEQAYRQEAGPRGIDASARLFCNQALSRAELELAVIELTRELAITSQTSARRIREEQARGAVASGLGIALFYLATFQALPGWLVVGGGTAALIMWWRTYWPVLRNFWKRGKP